MTADTSLSTEHPPQEPQGDSGTRRSSAIGGYSRPLDGLRFLLTAVVLGFHAGFEWAQGVGFSLSMFFTLSGYLITSLLLRNRRADGRLDLRRFWSRRFRRLMPAAMLTLAGVVVFAVPFADGSQLAKLPGQVISALFYVVNWYFIGTNQSYVAQFASPSPVVPFWSLSVEEQIYIIVPVALVFALRRTRSIRLLGWCFGVAAVASAAWMVALNLWGASIDRLYYGTDTRAAEFLVGSTLACIFLDKKPVLTDRLRSFLAVGSLVAIGVALFVWSSVPITDRAQYLGGYFGFSILSAVLIAALVLGAGALPRVLAWGPLPALGRITYGVYVIQWPIFLWLDQERTGLPRYPLLVIQLALIFGLATLSYHFIELPIRSGRRLRGSHMWIAAAAVAMAICVGVVVVSNHGPGDPLEPLANVSSAAPPLVVDDGKLDILVIADPAGRDMANAVKAQVAGSSDVEVTTGPAFGCPPSSTPTEDCPAWDTQWKDAIDEHDPDVVLLAVSNWDTKDIAAASGLGSTAGEDALTNWTETAMNRGIADLTTRGATVLWTPVLSTDLGLQTAWTNTPFGRVMSKLPSERNDIQRFNFNHAGPVGASLGDPAFEAASAASILRQAAPLQTRSSATSTRMLIVGDSVAASLGVGLERWAKETGKATVWTTALLGCGFVYEGEYQYTLGAQSGQMPTQCTGIQDQWRSQVDRFRPQVVVVSTTVWDVLPRKLPTWDSFLQPSNPTFDDFLLARYREALDIFTSRGAKVVWLESPCLTGDINKTIDYMNTTLLPRLKAEHPGNLEIYPFNRLVCPSGTQPDQLGGIANPRPDRVHFSPEASYWVAQQIGPQLIG